MKEFEITIIGGGHAGIEAAYAAAKLGVNTALISMEAEAIGRMSCNPAIGGVAKGQLVRDIDALGGVMGVVADKAGIQFRMLNSSKGPAVWGPRAQMDMAMYSQCTQDILKKFKNLTILSGEVDHLKPLRAEKGFELVVHTKEGTIDSYQSQKVIITSGTFLGGVMYTGLSAEEGGRVGEAAAKQLAVCLKDLGLKTRRLKTGTPARLNKDTIDFSLCTEQPGDNEPYPFSFRTEQPLRNDQVCWITHTKRETHDILRTGFSESPMFTGKIEGVGPRYCPSIEDKIDRFSEKESHQLFLEPEGLNSNRIYVNGFSSSLPFKIQEQALQTITGLENCEILQCGYAVEYDAIDATQLHPTYECKDIENLYFAGQVNGTSGYEEAAAQGLMAGINAVHALREKEPFILSRAESYIGVLTDDLVTQESLEPYRMFTSRAEYRLFLRQDNAETRLLEKGYELGLVDKNVYDKYLKRKEALALLKEDLEKTKIKPVQINSYFEERNQKPLKEGEKAIQLLRRPEVDLFTLQDFLPHRKEKLTKKVLLTLESEIKYAGFLERQEGEIKRTEKLGHLRIPKGFDYSCALSMSIESRQKLEKNRPMTVGNASRISGVSPSDISGLIFHINKRRENKE